jgi:hypothetical protein
MSKINLAEFARNHPDNDDGGDYRVVSVERVKGGLCFREECDQWFHAHLAPDEVRTFAAKLIEMLDEPEPDA